MYIRNGQPFDIHTRHEIDEMQYPAEWFQVPQHLETLGIVEVEEPTPPSVGAGEVAVLLGYEQVAGQWQPQWQVRAKTAAEVQQDADMLAAAKASKDAEINAARDAANGKTFPHNGKHVAIDGLSFKDIAMTGLYISLFGVFHPDFPGAWKYTDNSLQPMPTIDEFKAMVHDMCSEGSGNFQHAQALKAQVAAATSTSELGAIEW